MTSSRTERGHRRVCRVISRRRASYVTAAESGKVFTRGKKLPQRASLLTGSISSMCQRRTYLHDLLGPPRSAGKRAKKREEKSLTTVRRLKKMSSAERRSVREQGNTSIVDGLCRRTVVVKQQRWTGAASRVCVDGGRTGVKQWLQRRLHGECAARR